MFEIDYEWHHFLSDHSKKMVHEHRRPSSALASTHIFAQTDHEK